MGLGSELKKTYIILNLNTKSTIFFYDNHEIQNLKFKTMPAVNRLLYLLRFLILQKHALNHL